MTPITPPVSEATTRRADDIPGPPQGQWTYDAYATLPDDGNRYELIEGVLYVTAAPRPRHQKVQIRLILALGPHLIHGTPPRGELLTPTDVELAPGTVVQPDLVVVLSNQEAIIQETRLMGVPSLVVEIASPSTADHDRGRKQAAYAQAGVPEYWLVDPVGRTVEVLTLVATGRYERLGLATGDGPVPSRVLPELTITAAQCFPPDRLPGEGH